MFENELKLKGRLDPASDVEPGDVLPAKNKLKDLGLYKEPDYGMTPYPDEELFNGIKRTQRQGGLTVDGIMKPGGETESYVNKIWNEKYGQGKLNRDFGLSSPTASPSPQASSAVPLAARASLSNNGFTKDYNLRRKNLLNEDVKKSYEAYNRSTRQLNNPKPDYADWSKSAPYNYQGKSSLPTGRENIAERRYTDISTGVDEAFSKFWKKKNQGNPTIRSREEAELRPVVNQHHNIENIMPELFKHEGVKAYPYCDSNGNITVGIGSNVHNKNVFNTATWLDKEGNPVSQKHQDEQYRKMKKLCEKDKESNKAATAYEQESDIRLTQEEAERLAREHLANDHIELRKKIPDFDELPLSAQVALLDLQYNIGNRFSPEKWSKLYSALKEKDFERAAKEVHRYQLSTERNDWTEGKMREAAREWKRTHP